MSLHPHLPLPLPGQGQRTASGVARRTAHDGSEQNAPARGVSARVAAMVLVVSGCASPPTPPVATRINPDTWQPPIVFATRTTSVTPGAKPLGTAGTAGRPIAFISVATPAVAAALAKQMANAGLNVVPPGTPDALEVDVQLQAWMMPAGSLGRTQADVHVAQAIDQVLAPQSTAAEGGTLSTPGQPTAVTLPLGGWRTPIGQTGVSVGLAGFLFENLGNVTGARAKFNSFFGADATGTVCLFPAKSCARRKGPQQDFELRGSYKVGGELRTTTSTLLMVQVEPNIILPLAYAIADWRAAALGQSTPNCQFWKTGDRTPACEPLENMVPLKDLR